MNILAKSQASVATVCR